MSLTSAAFDALNRRGKTFIIRIKQELKSADKGSLVAGTNGATRIEGTRVVFEATAPEHYIFVDKGRRPGAKQPPTKPIEVWIKKRGLDLNAFAVARSIAKKGIKATNIYTDAIKDFRKDSDISRELSREIIKEIKIK